MTINFIIQAHKNPKQLARLIERLQHKASSFYIHIDKKSKLKPFKDVLSHYDNVFFFNQQRMDVVWGNISQVNTTLLMLNQLINDEKKGMCVFISGQDYPLKPVDYIHNFLQKNNNINFISSNLIDELWFSRIYNYNFHLNRINRTSISIPDIYNSEFYSNDTYRSIKQLVRSGKINQLKFLLNKRKFPSYLKPYGGANWWILPMDSIYFIIKFLKQNPSYISYHEHTHCPDEIFFQSIISSKISSKQIKPCLTYTDWSNTKSSSPLTFTLEHFESLKEKSNFLFARKFDDTIDEKILDKIDTKLLTKNAF